MKTQNKLSPKQKMLLASLEKNYFIVTKACQEVGMSRFAYYDWLRDPLFKKAVEQCESDLFQVIEDGLKTEALKRKPWAMRFYLARKHPEYKHKVEVSEGPDFMFEDDKDS